MKNLKLILVLGMVALLAAAAAGGAVWWVLGERAAPLAAVPGATAKPEEPAKPAPDYKYVTLDKVLIMLRGRSGDTLSHYMAIDVVFKTPLDQEKRAKEHLPLLRTIAVKVLSDHTVEAAQAMTVTQIADELNKAYRANYAAEQREPPFVEALIGKLIIE